MSRSNDGKEPEAGVTVWAALWAPRALGVGAIARAASRVLLRCVRPINRCEGAFIRQLGPENCAV